MAQVIQDKYILGQSSKVALTTPGSEIRIDLTLQSNTNTVIGANINGTVTAASAPVSGAYIKLMTENYVPAMHTITNADGKYFFNNVPQGNYYLFAISQGMNLNQSSLLTLKNHLHYTTDFTLTSNPSASLAIIPGRVVNSTTNNPIEGAVVSLFSKPTGGPDTLIAVAYTNQYGQYVFREIPKGTYSITITALNYQPLTVPVSITTDGEISPIPSSLIQSSAVSKGTVSGVIQDNTHTAIDNADVILYQVNTVTNALTPIAFTKTNVNGVYLFAGVDPGTYLVKANELEVVTVTVK